jgi:hypothetical protein
MLSALNGFCDNTENTEKKKTDKDSGYLTKDDYKSQAITVFIFIILILAL